MKCDLFFYESFRGKLSTHTWTFVTQTFRSRCVFFLLRLFSSMHAAAWTGLSAAGSSYIWAPTAAAAAVFSSSSGWKQHSEETKKNKKNPRKEKSDPPPASSAMKSSSQQTRWLSPAPGDRTCRFSPATPAARSRSRRSWFGPSGWRMDRSEARSEKSQLVLERNARMYSVHPQRWASCAFNSLQIN